MTGAGPAEPGDDRRSFGTGSRGPNAPSKPISISAQILLDQGTVRFMPRCTRFADRSPGTLFIDLGAVPSSGRDQSRHPSTGAGNTVQICPVSPTNARYRFRARPFDLVSVPTICCEHCASGCAMRTDVRRGEVQRRLAGDDPEVKGGTATGGRFRVHPSNGP